MAKNTYYGLEFTYHSGSEQKFYDSQNARDSIFDTWKKKLNAKDYVDPKVKSVRKIKKTNESDSLNKLNNPSWGKIK